MASWKAAILLGPALAATFALPRPLLIEGYNEARGSRSHVLALHEPSASIELLVDCPQCFEATPNKIDNELVFDIQALSSDRACGDANLKVNGETLIQDWNSTTAHGSGTLSTRRKNFLGYPEPHQLSASWNTTCLFNTLPTDGSISNGEDAAQVLTFAIHKVDGRDTHGSPGFTLSYKLFQHAHLIRVEPSLVSSASDVETAEQWRDPPPQLRLSSNHRKGDLQEESQTLEEKVEELNRLKGEAKALQRLIDEKEAALKKAVKHDLSFLKEDIKQCDGVQCVVRAVYRKAHDAIRSMIIRFRSGHHHEPEPTAEGLDRLESYWSWSKARKHIHHQGDDSYASPSPHTAQHGIAGHGPGELLEWSPPPSTNLILGESEPQPLPSHHQLRPHLHQPSRNIVYYSALAAFQIVLATLGIISLFIFVRRRFVDPRRRAERLARREERENTRSFRRAARRQAWRNWWQGRRGTADYGEKRRLIIEQENVLENAMQAEIRQLQNAHSVVSSIVPAEEGRVTLLGVQRQNSLPDYRSESGETEPPAYDEYDESELAVADGFQYAGPGTVHYTPGGSDWTPESSVVDTSPRSSDCGSVRDGSD